MNKLSIDRDLDSKIILVTGAAGFIGSHLIKYIMESFPHVIVVGIDNMNNYYDKELKQYRLKQIRKSLSKGPERFVFIKQDISDADAVRSLVNEYPPSIVVNLAAQAGVRYSITNPDDYINSNIVGFYNILEACRHSYDRGAEGVQHLVYASSSSVYGGNRKVPFSETDTVDKPVSLYAATKKSNELLAYSYSKLYNLPCSGLRFFTVYGPAGRPDMAYFLFAKKLQNGEKIKIFNYGNCRRDFTYIDNIVKGIVSVMENPPERQTGEDGLPFPPYEIYNIGNSHPENLKDFVYLLVEELIRAQVLPDEFDVQSHMEFVPMQQGDVPVTYADISKLERNCGFRPSTDLRTGLRAFAEWYKEYYTI